MDSLVEGAASPTYQCVVCQSTCLTPNELHRHQSYRHTSEELSLSIIGVHNAAIRTFDFANGIVYDNSWLYDPNRHAEFYTYSANMLCDDNNNGDVVDYAFKAFKDRVVEESGPAAVPDDEHCTHDLDRCVDDKCENDNFAEAQNFEQESSIGESKILDLRLKIDFEVETEIRMDTARDNFWGCCKVESGEVENIGRNNKKSRSSKTCVNSQNFEKSLTGVSDGLASKILDLGRKVFSQTHTDTVKDDLEKHYEGSLSCSHIEASGNLGRDVDEKSKDLQIETCQKVQNLDEPQSCVQESEILDLSQKFYSEVQPETHTDTSANNFGKSCEELCRNVGNLKGKTGKRRSSPSKCPTKIKARKLTMPGKKPESPKQGAAKSANTENRESGNVDSAKQKLQGSQDSPSWFESEASKIKRFNDKVKQIRASQKKPLNLTKVACKQVKGEGRGKSKKRTMSGCSREYTVWSRESFDSEDWLGFDGEGATINATSSRNARRPRVPRKKAKICAPAVHASFEETAERPKKPLEETTGLTPIFTEHSSTVDSDESVFAVKSKKSTIHAPTAGQSKKLRVSWKDEKISKTEADNSAELPKRPPKEETAGETEITLNSAEHSSIIGSDQSLFELESIQSKIHSTTSAHAKKPKISKKKGKISETEVNSFAQETADLLKKLLEEEIAGETQITQNQDDGNGNRAERSSIFSPDKYSSHSERKKSKVCATTSGNAKKPIVSKKRENISETVADNSADETVELLKLLEEETAGDSDSAAEQESTGATEKLTNQNCAKKAGLQSNWDFESPDFMACPNGDVQKIKAMYAGNVEAQTKNVAVVDVTAELLRDLPAEPSKEETPRETKKLQNWDDENGNCAEQSSIFGSVESTIHFESKEGRKINAAASGSANKPIASKRKARNPKTVADKPTERETTKPANQKCAEEVRPRPNWDFGCADFLACSDGDGQQINTTCAKNAGVQAGKTAVEVTAELLRDVLMEPSEEDPPGAEKLQNEDCENEGSIFSSDEYLYYFPSEEAKMAVMSSGYTKQPVASGKKSNNLKTVSVWPGKKKMTRKIVNYGNGNSSKQSSASSRDVFSYTGSEGEEVSITPLSKFRAERSSALGKKPKNINAEDENCAGHDSNFVSNIYAGKDRGNKRVEIEGPSAGKPKKRQVKSKKSSNSERLSDKSVEEVALEMPKLFYQDCGSEIFVSQNSPPIIDVNSSTESGNEEEMSRNAPTENFTKSSVVRNKKNLKTADDEPALRGTTRTPQNSENREHDNVISIYKDSSLVPGGSSATDNELPPVTFIAYPPYVDENSILVLNPISRELVWKCLDTEDSQLDDTANYHWHDRGSHQEFSETGRATTSRNVDSEKSASFVPAAIGTSASSEKSLRKTNVVRRSTRPRKVILRYNS